MAEDEAFRDWIRRVRAGDQQAAAELVRQYEGEVRRLVRLQLGPRLRRAVDSVDICQSVLGNFFVRAAAGQFDLNEPAQLLKLLATMARNRVLDHARRTANRTVTGGKTLAAAPWRGESPSQALSFKELLEKVRALLSDEERFLAEQRAQGRGWSDIAAECGGTPEALRKKFARALDRAARAVGLEGAGPG
jgi:DNA-directed RNA polymerase specialized sigma24 family protein